MAENTPLGVVIGMVRAQIGFPCPPLGGGGARVNTAEDGRLAALIDAKQKWLADEWDWPTLGEWWDAPVAPGQRYPLLPVAAVQDGQNAGTLAFNKRRPLLVNNRWNAYWNEIAYGISEQQEYNNIDSDLGQTNDPILRWDYNDTTTFEVWPIPASAQTVRFRGQRVLNSLLTSNPGQPPTYNPEARLDLDDLMVTLFVAADYLNETEDKQSLGKIKLGEAMRQMNRVRGVEPRREQKYVMGRSEGTTRVKLAEIKIIAVHS